MEEKNKLDEISAKKRPKAKRIVFQIFLAVVAILLALFLTAYCIAVSKLNKMDRTSGKMTSGNVVTGSYDVEEEESNPIDASDDDSDEKAMREAVKGLEERTVIAATGDVFADSDVFNILLIGTDERTEEFSTNARGDACLLLSVNKATGAMHLVSFERGIGVPILEGQYEGQYDWLTHTLRYGGAELMMKEIRECFKVDVTHYVRVNFNTFVDGINAIGGVDINLTQAEADYINRATSETNHIYHVSVGKNHLNGETALYYARCRKIDSDWFRIGRQRTVIQAALDQVSNLNIIEINGMLDTVLPLVQTNLTNKDVFGLALTMPRFLGQKLEQATIPLPDTYGSMTGMGGRSLYAVDFDTNAKELQKLLYGRSTK